jgi:hypothetical protein
MKKLKDVFHDINSFEYIRDNDMNASIIQLSETLGFNLTQSLSDCYEMIEMGYADRAKTWLNYIGWLFVGAQMDDDEALKEVINEMVVEEATLDLDSRLAALFDEKT